MRPRGFTLIELIVVIAVVAMLMALLMPVLHGAREQAKSTLCQTHIHQLLVEFQQYHDSENGLFPWGLDAGRWPAPPSDYAGDFRWDPPGWWWFDYLEASSHTPLGDSGIIECPSRRLGAELARDILCGNYGVNRSLCRSKNDSPPYNKLFGEPAVSINDVRCPGSTLLIVDCGYALVCWLNATDEPPVELPVGTPAAKAPYVPGLEINKSRPLEPSQVEDAISGRHPGKTVNIGFADGHVGRKKADELLVKRIDEDAYANLSPLWNPK